MQNVLLIDLVHFIVKVPAIPSTKQTEHTTLSLLSFPAATGNRLGITVTYKRLDCVRGNRKSQYKDVSTPDGRST